MRSAEPGRVRIIEAAMGLFALHGVEATTVKAIGAAAGVSPPLVHHHFGSKEGLRRAVDDHVVDAVRAMFGDLDVTDPSGLTAELLHRMAGEGATLAYLRRSLREGGAGGTELFDRLVEATEDVMAELEVQGLARPSADPRARALVVLTLDLGSLVLEPHLARHLGEEIWTVPPSARWFGAVVDLLGSGLFVAPRPTRKERDP